MGLVYITDGTDAFQLDATKSFSTGATNNVTEYPIESGFDVTKGVISKGDTFSMTGIISDHHLSSGYLNRSDDIFSSLKALKDNRKVVSVVAKGSTQVNLVISNLTSTESSDGGHAKDVTISFKKIRIAVSANSKIPREARLPDITDLSEPVKPKGVQSKSWWATGVDYSSSTIQSINKVITGD